MHYGPVSRPGDPADIYLAIVGFNVLDGLHIHNAVGMTFNSKVLFNRGSDQVGVSPIIYFHS